MITEKQLKQLLPIVCKWAKEQENLILSNGVPLCTELIPLAEKVGVTNPYKARLLKVNKVPFPDDKIISNTAKSIGFISKNIAGLTLRYGIFIRSDYWNNKKTIIHELVHTAQYEKLGGIFQFLEKYLMECISQGYAHSCFEREATEITGKLCP